MYIHIYIYIYAYILYIVFIFVKTNFKASHILCCCEKNVASAAKAWLFQVDRF